MEPHGSATNPLKPSGVTDHASGTPEGVFLQECNERWRKWAAALDIGTDPSAGGAPIYKPGGRGVWVGAGESLASIAAAAPVWGWTPL